MEPISMFNGDLFHISGQCCLTRNFENRKRLRKNKERPRWILEFLIN